MKLPLRDATKFCLTFSMLILMSCDKRAKTTAEDSLKTAPEIANSQMDSIVIHQEIDFKVSPQRVYETLLSSTSFSNCTNMSFSIFTASSAKIDPVVGGAFSVFDGHIVGRILELVPDKRIVEAWRVVDWPEGVYSVAKFELKSTDAGTKLIFDHVGFPKGLKEHLST